MPLELGGQSPEIVLDDCDVPTARRGVWGHGGRFGFSDAARFSHAFRKRYGASPSEYRRQGR